MKSEDKFILGEAALVFGLSVPITVAVFITFLPGAILLTYIRIQLWDWFAIPYLHLPMIPFWAMFGLTTFAGTFYYASAPVSDYKPTMKQNVTVMVTNVKIIHLTKGYAEVSNDA